MSDTINLGGLSLDAIHQVKSLVETLRLRENGQKANQRDPEEWSAALRKWAASHVKREIVIDDSRESIYGERCE